ncbi:hypothetical protein COU95_00460 [Candidatus Shapirobacteria bacterium CG10_big_fil_rev_8_21_14_0_10_40_9]|uniref:Uncharacterized protein n=1 Tax=Candidatus Shapirobacteria bacterium CG10_big_fil_rev_8_21_14_0_10_40_9 TaxID=1974888 RepID=A0A2M8L4F0_9BACT|nr:MAG: hypothetical protein COU95_00460 [Candidatus Shapirobacteria bacterium CG10_big_fil_rev_8_21_14_0_10_40_9]
MIHDTSMPQVSRHPLAKDVYQEITQELGWILSSIGNEKEMTQFLGDLLTKTERMMLAKRLTIARLLIRGWKWSEICEFLKVSKATVNRMQHWLEGGGQGFRLAVKKLDRKENVEKFWQKVDSVIKYMGSVSRYK